MNEVSFSTSAAVSSISAGLAPVMATQILPMRERSRCEASCGGFVMQQSRYRNAVERVMQEADLHGVCRMRKTGPSWWKSSEPGKRRPEWVGEVDSPVIVTSVEWKQPIEHCRIQTYN